MDATEALVSAAGLLRPMFREEMADVWGAETWRNVALDVLTILRAGIEPEQETRITRLLDIEASAVELLAELVNLKDLKDREGKTLAYRQYQPEAWRKARQLLAELDELRGTDPRE